MAEPRYLEQHETEHWRFTCIGSDEGFKLIKPYDELPKGNTRHFVVGNASNIFVAAGQEGLVFGSLSDLRHACQSETELSSKSTYPVPFRIQAIELSSDESKLAICAEDGGVHVYSTTNFDASNSDESKVCSIQTEKLIDIQARPKFGNEFAVLDQSNNLYLLNTSDESYNKISSNVTAFSWSKLGKQLLCGLSTGEINQIKTDSSITCTIQKPGGLSVQFKPLFINWLENKEVLLAYSQPSEPEEFDFYVYMGHRASGLTGDIEWEQVDDPTPAFGDVTRDLTMYSQVLRGWHETLPMLIILSAGPSSDVTMLTEKHSFTFAEDSARATLPFGDTTDTGPVGMCFDFSSTEDIKEPAAGYESSQPQPILWILNNEGTLSGWYVIWTDALKNKSITLDGVKDHHKQNVKDAAENATQGQTQNQNQTQTQAQSPIQTQTQPQPTFGQSPFGATGQTPVFGQTSFGGGAPAPAFGQSSFGTPSKTPAFGQSSFGTPSKTPAFGQSTFGSASSKTPAFGQSSFGQGTSGQSPFGQASTGKSVFGDSSNTGGFAAFTQNTNNNAFGGAASTSTSGFGSLGQNNVFGSSKSSEFPSKSPSSFQMRDKVEDDEDEDEQDQVAVGSDDDNDDEGDTGRQSLETKRASQGELDLKIGTIGLQESKHASSSSPSEQKPSGINKSLFGNLPSSTSTGGANLFGSQSVNADPKSLFANANASFASFKNSESPFANLGTGSTTQENPFAPKTGQGSVFDTAKKPEEEKEGPKETPKLFGDQKVQSSAIGSGVFGQKGGLFDNSSAFGQQKQEPEPKESGSESEPESETPKEEEVKVVEPKSADTEKKSEFGELSTPSLKSATSESSGVLVSDGYDHVSEDYEDEDEASAAEKVEPKTEKAEKDERDDTEKEVEERKAQDEKDKAQVQVKSPSKVKPWAQIQTESRPEPEPEPELEPASESESGSEFEGFEENDDNAEVSFESVGNETLESARSVMVNSSTQTGDMYGYDEEDEDEVESEAELSDAIDEVLGESENRALVDEPYGSEDQPLSTDEPNPDFPEYLSLAEHISEELQATVESDLDQYYLETNAQFKVLHTNAERMKNYVTWHGVQIEEALDLSDVYQVDGWRLSEVTQIAYLIDKLLTNASKMQDEWKSDEAKVDGLKKGLSSVALHVSRIQELIKYKTGEVNERGLKLRSLPVNAVELQRKLRQQSAKLDTDLSNIESEINVVKAQLSKYGSSEAPSVQGVRQSISRITDIAMRRQQQVADLARQFKSSRESRQQIQQYSALSTPVKSGGAAGMDMSALTLAGNTTAATPGTVYRDRVMDEIDFLSKRSETKFKTVVGDLLRKRQGSDILH